MTKPTKWHLHPAKTQISLGMRTAKTLTRLGGCPGWSESSLGAQVILLVLSCGGSDMPSWWCQGVWLCDRVLTSGNLNVHSRLLRVVVLGLIKYPFVVLILLSWSVCSWLILTFSSFVMDTIALLACYFWLWCNCGGVFVCWKCQINHRFLPDAVLSHMLKYAFSEVLENRLNHQFVRKMW